MPTPTPDPISAAASPAELEALVGAPPTSCSPTGVLTGEVAFAPAWEPGVVRNLRLRTERDRADDAIPDGAFATADVALTVVADTATGWEFDWATDGLSLDALGIPAEFRQEAEELIGDVLSPSLRYGLDFDGYIEGLLNSEEVMAALLAFVDRIAAFDPEAAEMRTFIDQIDPATFELLFLEDPSVYHFFDNALIDVDRPLVIDDLLPNNFGGEPFPAVTSMEVVPSAPGDNCVTLVLTTEPDPERFAEILFETLEAVFGEAPPEDELGSAEWSIVNRSVVRLDAGTGLVSSIVADQSVTVDGLTQGDRLIIVDVTESLSE